MEVGRDNIETRAQQLRDESPLFRYTSEELHEQLVDYQSDLKYEDDIPRPAIIILGERNIEVNETGMSLTTNKTFALNALRLTQGYPMTMREIFDLGFRGPQSTLSTVLTRLARDFADVDESPIIETEYNRETNENSYTLLPEVEIIDERDDQARIKWLIRDCAPLDENGGIRIDSEGAIDFSAPRKRRRATKAMLNDYRVAVDSDLAIARLLEKHIGYRSTAGSQIMPIRPFPRLDPEEENSLLWEKEQGLLTYLETAGEPDEVGVAAITDAVKAYYALFFRHIHMAQTYAARWCSNQNPYSDIYQEAAICMLDTIASQGCSSQPEVPLGMVIAQDMKNLSHKWVSSRLAIDATVGYKRDKRIFTAAYEELNAEKGREPSATELAERAGMRVDKVLGILAIEKGIHYIDSEVPDTNGLTQADLLADEADTMAETLHDTERKAAIEAIFEGSDLSETEKIILSLHFKIYRPSLEGAQLSSKKKVEFIYPESEEEFYALADPLRTLNSINTMLGFSGTAAERQYRRALRKARALLIDNPAFDNYGRTDTVEYRLDWEAEEAERQHLVNQALELSPNKRLSAKEIAALRNDEKFDANEARLIDLFGSVPEFQAACGFEPRKTVDLSKVSNDDLVRIALQIRPDGPLSANDVKLLSKQGDFVSTATIRKRFGGMRGFHQACGFEV